MSDESDEELTEAGKTYEVGYKKPPKHTRFGPGNRGNRNGRPKRSKNLKTDFAEEMKETVRIQEGGKSKLLTKQRVMIKRLWAKAMAGDPRAINTVLNLNMRLMGMDDAETSATELNAEDQEVLNLVLGRGTRAKGASGGEK